MTCVRILCRVRNSTVNLGLGFLFLTSCSGDSPVASPALHTGTYALQAIDGVPLPVTLVQTATGRTRLLADTLRFGAQEGRYVQLPVLGEQQGTEPERTTRVTSSAALTYTQSTGNQLVLSGFYGSEGPATANRIGTADIEVTRADGQRWRYVRQ
jgi:hypothetical protein